MTESPFLIAGSWLQKGDFVFYTCLLVSVFFFVAIESSWLIRKFSAPGRAKVLGENSDLIWSIIPALVLLSLSYV